MTFPAYPRYTAFVGHRRLASGPLHEVALAAKAYLSAETAEPVLLFDDQSGRTIDVDLRGSSEQVASRLAVQPPGETETTDAPRGRGRPRLGVVAREVTLLPRHWEWLTAQPGGASVALRRLVEDARRTRYAQDERRDRQSAAYHFMSAMAGDRPGFEEAIRALFANDQVGLLARMGEWPSDIRNHAALLAGIANNTEISA